MTELQTGHAGITTSVAGAGAEALYRKLAAGHLKMWGTTREGMSEFGFPAKAAWLENGQIILVSHGAMTRNDMPPGFKRFLTAEELQVNGLDGVDLDATMRLGRKRNDLPAATQQRNKPYYRQFDKRKY